MSSVWVHVDLLLVPDNSGERLLRRLLTCTEVVTKVNVFRPTIRGRDFSASYVQLKSNQSNH